MMVSMETDALVLVGIVTKTNHVAKTPADVQAYVRKVGRG